MNCHVTRNLHLQKIPIDDLLCPRQATTESSNIWNCYASISKLLSHWDRIDDDQKKKYAQMAIVTRCDVVRVKHVMHLWSESSPLDFLFDLC